MILLLTNCRKDPVLEVGSSVGDIEIYVRSTRDSWAVFSYNQYRQLLLELTKDKYVVRTLNDFRSYHDSTKIVVGLRHDVDWHPFKAVEMAQFEYDLELQSTWYILPTAPYFASLELGEIFRYSSMAPVYKSLSNLNHEVGIHNDLLTTMAVYGFDPFDANAEDTKFIREMGIRIYGTASHGAKIAQETHVLNYEIFSDFARNSSFSYKGKSYPLGKYSMAQYGFQYEAYHLDYDLYLSDVGGVWNVEGGRFSDFLRELKEVKVGTRVVILVHPVWWGV